MPRQKNPAQAGAHAARVGGRLRAGCLLRQADDAHNPLLRDAGWGSGSGGEECSRAQLMWALQQRLPPSVMIPDRRLEALLEQALEAQVGFVAFLPRKTLPRPARMHAACKTVVRGVGGAYAFTSRPSRPCPSTRGAL